MREGYFSSIFVTYTTGVTFVLTWRVASSKMVCIWSFLFNGLKLIVELHTFYMYSKGVLLIISC